jgi:hypothetical protein
MHLIAMKQVYRCELFADSHTVWLSRRLTLARLQAMAKDPSADYRTSTIRSPQASVRVYTRLTACELNGQSHALF